MLKQKLEALLFSSGRKMNMEELSKLSRSNPEDIQKSLMDLKKDYETKNSSVMIVNEGPYWKLTVREDFLNLVQKIVTETEMSKTIMETLAVIAFRYPIKQSDLIKIRTNKAYDHLKELEELGYITRQKHSRTNLIKLSQKFFEYFDLSQDKLKEKFQDFSSIAKAIENKEQEIETIKQEQKERAEESKQSDEDIKNSINSIDENSSETQENKEIQTQDSNETEENKEKLDNLDVVDEPSEEEQQIEKERIENITEQGSQVVENHDDTKPESSGIKLTKEEEKIVDEKVEKIIHPPKDQDEDQDKDKEIKPKKEPKDLLEASIDEKEKQDKESQ